MIQTAVENDSSVVDRLPDALVDGILDKAASKTTTIKTERFVSS